MKRWTLSLFVSAILAPLTIGLSGSASAGYGNVIRLNIRNGDVVPTLITIIPDFCSNIPIPATAPGLFYGQILLDPNETYPLDFNHDPSGDCDDDLGYFAIKVEYNQLKTSFTFFENGPLQVRTDLPPPVYAYKTFTRVGNGPQGAGEYVWETTPAPFTLAKPVGHWDHICQPACTGVAKREMTSSKNQAKTQSVETTQSISATIEAGIEVDGFSAGASVTASATQTLAHSLSQETASGTLSSLDITFGVTREVALANDIFAVWRWTVSSPQRDGAVYTFLTGMFTCTPGGDPPSYLPGSVEDIAACQTPGGVGTIKAKFVDPNQHGLTGTWYEPATNGQGVLTEVFPNLIGPGTGRIQVSWFTYATSPVGGPDRQRWYTMGANVATGAAGAVLPIYENVGGNFNAGPVTNSTQVGTATLSFADCDHATLDYAFTDGSGRGDRIDLTRLTKNVTCVGTGTRPVNADFAFSGNWYDPATSGQGFTLDINPLSPVAFFAWYTYAPGGAAAGAAGQRWYTGNSGFAAGARTLTLKLYETTHGLFDAPSTPAPTQVEVGSATLTFKSCTTATLAYNFTGGTSSGAVGQISLTKIGPAGPGCVM